MCGLYLLHLWLQCWLLSLLVEMRKLGRVEHIEWCRFRFLQQIYSASAFVMLRVVRSVNFEFLCELVKRVLKKKESVSLLFTSRNATVDIVLRSTVPVVQRKLPLQRWVTCSNDIMYNYFNHRNFLLLKYSVIQKDGLNFISLCFKIRTSDNYDVNCI
jgi:hypothetical protein